MKSLTNKKEPLWQYLLPVFVTVAVLLVILAIKGVYPFGEYSIALYDMNLMEIPSFIYSNDVLHGVSGLFYDWFTACGTERNSLLTLLDPFMLVLMVLPRTFIMKALTYWIVLKFAVLSYVSILFFKKTFPALSYHWQFFMSLFYTMSAYTLRYYPNTAFLNYVILLPLLVMAVLKLFKDGKYVPFILCLTYILITSVYFAFFFILFLILIGAMFIYCFYDKPARGEKAFRLGVGTGASLLIGAPVFIPSLMSIFGGARFNNASYLGNSAVGSDSLSAVDKLKDVLLADNGYNFNKLFMLLGLEFAVATLILLIFRHKNDKRRVSFFVLSTVAFVLPIAFENINLIWHGGSYNGYSMRYGFMLVFVLLCAAAYYYDKYDSARDGTEKNLAIKYGKFVVVMLFSFVTAAYYNIHRENGLYHGVFSYDKGGYAKNMTETYLWALGALVIFFLLIRLFKNKKFRTAFTSLILAVLLVLNSYWMFVVSTDDKSTKTISYIYDGYELYDSLSEENRLIRIANKDDTLWPNADYILDRSSVGGWTHTIDTKTKEAFAHLGYSTEYTVLLDSGASPLTDSLMNVRDYIAGGEMPDKLYDFEKKLTDEYSLYSSEYSLPFGVMLSENALSDTEFTNVFDYQNTVASYISGKEEKLFIKAEYDVDEYVKTVDASETSIKPAEGETEVDINARNYTFELSRGEVLYVAYDDCEGFIKDTADYKQFSVYENGEKFNLSYFEDRENNKYPVAFVNGMTRLTDGTSGKYTFEFDDISESSDSSRLMFYKMKISALADITASAKSAVTGYSTSKNGVNITLDGSGDGYMFIPLRYADNWQCFIDGKKTETKCVLGNFTAVKIENGQTSVELKYVPTDAVISAIVFAVLLIIALAAFYIAERKHLEPSKALCVLAKAAFSAVFAVTVTAVYILPLAAQIYLIFKK